MRSRLPLTLAWLLLVSPAHAGIRYVNAALTTGANDGSSWSNAYRGPLGMKAAFQNAVAGDEVWAAQGVYKPALLSNPGVSFVLQSGVQYYGGFTGSETSLDQRDPAAHVTFLDGDLADNDDTHVYTDNTENVINGGTADSSALLDGFTIQGGSSSGSGGGGMLCLNDCTPGVRNCVFRENRGMNGAAVYVQGASPRFHYTRFEDNHAVNVGGAFYVQNSILVSFTGCVFVENTANAGGAGYAHLVTTLHLTNCAFVGNQAVGYGGYSIEGGGALLLMTSGAFLDGCTVADNRALVGNCGGVRNLFSNAQMSNSIVYFNQGPSGGMGFADNMAGVTATWSCVQGILSGPGNISVDPHFAALASGDPHLAVTSPCCDAGNNVLVPPTGYLDADGMPRYEDDHYAADTGLGTAPIVDMGAFEARDPLYLPFCFGDGSLATACPCANFGSVGAGCRNSDIFSLGAWLAVTGSVDADSVVLEGSELLPGVTCVFLQGDQQNAIGVMFGDGVRCVSGTLKRLYMKPASAGAVSAPAAGEPSIRARSAALGDTILPGTLRCYQVYYRDPDPYFCPAPQGNTWNVTSGVIIAW